MDNPLPIIEKKKSKSFWNRILHLHRKPQCKEKYEDSFRRQSALYSSLHSTNNKTNSNIKSEESENFTTLEHSAFMEVHKNAGILFLNKNSVANCYAQQEENRHVQFAPTPMNKYYKVDSKFTSSKQQNDENKENMQQISCLKPTRSILRLNKDHKINFQSLKENTNGNDETRLVNAKYVEGPQVKTPSMPRTSTKLTLNDHKNRSLSQLNISSIVKYNSLPMQAKLTEEIVPYSDVQKHMVSLESLPVSPDRERSRKYIQNLNIHRQSCYGVSNPSRILEGKKVLHAQHSSSQSLRNRLSLGGSSLKINDSSYNSGKIAQTCHLKVEACRNFKIPKPLRGPSSVKSLEQSMQIASKQEILMKSKSGKLIKYQHHSSTSNIPNKSINEIGLPLVINNQKKCIPNEKTRLCSKSPQYIALSEMSTSNKIESKEKKNTAIQSKCLSQHLLTESSAAISQKYNTSNQTSTIIEAKAKKYKKNISKDNQNTSISEKRKHEIMSTMHMQKQKIANRICKYKSKECEDGFSSMADDECSFNCSCSSCVMKLSHNYKQYGLKNLSPFNKDKYFFTIEPDIIVGNDTERLPENQTFEGPMKKAQPHLSQKLDYELTLKKSRYDCSDILSQTPYKTSNIATLTPTNEVVNNIYENITQIINTETKQNISSQDIKNLFSTPVSSPINHEVMIKPQRTLFKDDMNEKQKIFELSYKEIHKPDNSDCFNDSIVLLQEIFQKLSQECKELLKPNAIINTFAEEKSKTIKYVSPTNKYMNDLIKNLKSDEINESDFATIIGGIAHNIFSETKAKRKERYLTYSRSLPDLKKVPMVDKAISVGNSLQDLFNLKNKYTNLDGTVSPTSHSHINKLKTESLLSINPILDRKYLPDGWSKSSTTEDSNVKNDASSIQQSNAGTDNSNYSETDLQLLEKAIRLGMGLTPADKMKKTPIFVTSPTKASKYKSRDVLSGKGKLKLKIYYNSGLVTVYVMKAAKLNWTSGRDLNSYVKITMMPDESKRVHWRTTVQKAEKNPVYNQKFSFELLTEDETKRLIFSIWHRDYAKQRSELIGCMSFSVRHVMDNAHNIDGWYRLLREKFGTQKHFAAHAHKNSYSPLDLLK